MNVTLRLYKRHDLDLIPVVTSSTFKLTKQIKGAIRAYLNDEPFRIPIESVAAVDNERGTYLLHFCINREKEPDLFTFVTSLKTGKRNSAIKNLLRYYLDTIYLGEYLNDKELLRYPSNNLSGEAEDKKPKEAPIPTRQTKPIIKQPSQQKVETPIKPNRPSMAKTSEHENTVLTAKEKDKTRSEKPDIPPIDEREAEQDDGDFDFMNAMENLLDSARDNI